MRHISRTILTISLLALPSVAHAQVQVAPFAGVTFGGDTTTTSGSAGVSATYWVRTWIGVEAEAAFTPMLFEQDGFLTSRSMTTVTGSVIATAPRFGTDRWKPFVVAGMGLMRPNLAEAGGLATAKGNTLGLSAGAGVMGFLNDHVGWRADVRYFRGLRDSDLDANPFGVDFSTFAYWRTTGGLVVRF